MWGVLGEFIQYLGDEIADGHGWIVLLVIAAIVGVAALIIFLMSY